METELSAAQAIARPGMKRATFRSAQLSRHFAMENWPQPWRFLETSAAAIHLSQRRLTVLLFFCVNLTTLVAQGLSLPG
jgi:hypothetical protein